MARGEAQRAFILRQKYGLTTEQYDGMLAEQGGVCAICKQPETRTAPSGEVVALCVDHDHKCCPGKMTCGACLRGLLCQRCNVGIGALAEDIGRLEAAAHYIRRFQP